MRGPDRLHLANGRLARGYLRLRSHYDRKDVPTGLAVRVIRYRWTRNGSPSRRWRFDHIFLMRPASDASGDRSSMTLEEVQVFDGRRTHSRTRCVPTGNCGARRARVSRRSMRVAGPFSASPVADGLEAALPVSVHQCTQIRPCPSLVRLRTAGVAPSIMWLAQRDRKSRLHPCRNRSSACIGDPSAEDTPVY